MQHVLIIGPACRARDARVNALEVERIGVKATEAMRLESGGPAPSAVVLDAADMTSHQIEAALAEHGEGPPVLVIHGPPRHGEAPLRDRRAALLEAGAADTMLSTEGQEDFVTRVRALLLRERPPRVLLVEDEPEIAAWAASELAGDGVDAVVAGDLASARAALAQAPADALVVDRMLPDGEGLDLVRELRRNGVRMPILVYTALREGAQWIEGREAGADDYVGKPIDADELRARVRFILRPKRETETLVFGPLEIVRAEQRVLWRGAPLALSDRGRGGRTEFALLAYLAERQGLKVPIRMLLQDLWHQPFANPDSNPATTAKRRLANRLKSVGAPPVIVTEGGAYRFDPGPLLALDAARPGDAP